MEKIKKHNEDHSMVVKHACMNPWQVSNPLVWTELGGACVSSGCCFGEPLAGKVTKINRCVFQPWVCSCFFCLPVLAHAPWLEEIQKENRSSRHRDEYHVEAESTWL